MQRMCKTIWSTVRENREKDREGEGKSRERNCRGKSIIVAQVLLSRWLRRDATWRQRVKEAEWGRHKCDTCTFPGHSDDRPLCRARKPKCASREKKAKQKAKQKAAGGRGKKGANINHKLDATAAAAAGMEATQNEARTHKLDHSPALRMRNSLAQSGSKTGWQCDR